MKICICAISDFLNVQGSTEPYYVYRCFKSRHQVIAIVPGSRECASAEQDVLHVRRIKGLPTFISYNLFSIPYLLLSRVRDAQLVYTYIGIITPVLFLKFLLRKKWVCDFRSSPLAQELEFRKLQGTLTVGRRLAYSLARWFYRVTLPRCDLIVTLSQEIQDELIRDYHVSAGKIFLLPLGVNLTMFSPRGTRPPVQEDGLRLVYSGAVAPQRGLDIVIQALSFIKGRVPARLVIVGRGPQDAVNHLQGLAQKLGVAGMIEWKGFVPHDHVPEILDTCHVGLSPLPRLRAYEVSSPAKIMEYLAMGIPVIATDILAHRKVIHHEENGLLVPPEDSQALAQAIKRLYNNPILLAQMAAHARKSVLNYSWDTLLQGLERRLQELVR